MMRALIGRAEALPPSVLAEYEELRSIRVRRGGLPPRVAGWLLGQRTVAAVTLWSTVWLGASARVDDELLLHEARHVMQFREDWLFPVRYLLATARHGYHANPYEIDARKFAAVRVGTSRGGG